MRDCLNQLASRVLIVDDEVHIARFLQFLLRQQGYQTCLAHDGQQALDEYQRFMPDAILLDVVLPKRSGLDVLREIRHLSNSPSSGPLVLLLTAMNLQDIPVDIMNLGDVAHCPKPIAPSSLFRILQAHGLYGYARPLVAVARS